MALFVLILVGVVVVQTWFDWRDTQKSWVVPEWAKGMALGGMIAVSFTAAASIGAVWLREDSGQWSEAFGSRTFWPEAAFVLGAMGILVVAVRKKWMRFLLLFAGVLIAAAVWLGMSL